VRSQWDTPTFDGVLLRVHCDVEDVHVTGDHDLVIGRVLALETPEDEARPLLFYRGRFGVDDPTAPLLREWGWGHHWG
jgi:flavin reductase (DIM6/NTAB) family NADH-FMN oxidoreductase RutF